jgi:hypothetical protein
MRVVDRLFVHLTATSQFDFAPSESPPQLAAASPPSTFISSVVPQFSRHTLLDISPVPLAHQALAMALSSIGGQ